MSPYSKEQTATGSRDGLSPNQRHELLRSEARRVAIDILSTKTDPIDLRELAAKVAYRLDGRGADERTIERVAVEFHHNHLPRMTEVEIVDYDPESHTIFPEQVPDDLTVWGQPEEH